MSWARGARFLLAVWRANLLSAMEYRVSFLAQVAGMFLNDAALFGFWTIYFQRFHEVRGWRLADVLLLFGTVAAGFGCATYLFGNVLRLATVIAEGELDYYLSLPRPALLHALASRSVPSGLGDLLFGFATLAAVGAATPGEAARFALGAALGAAVFVGFLVVVGSLSFWIGDATLLSGAVTQGMIMFSTYPFAVFDGWTRLLLFSLLPAAFVGAVPASLVRSFTWQSLGELGLAAALSLAAGTALFQRGLARYQSGSAMQARV
ncbi:MAG TPA: ABC-2 family transporter protein [Candidatus Dormibacteraeota bacterium]|nr:ABC-2 family transporter protein [Candidatus Dormibacteraeota bacterium]